MGASPHAGCHCPGTRADAFRVVFARNPVAHTPRKHVEGALKHAKITAKTLRQVMRRKLRSTGRKSATNYLSGTTLILTINICGLVRHAAVLIFEDSRQTPGQVEQRPCFVAVRSAPLRRRKGDITNQRNKPLQRRLMCEWYEGVTHSHTSIGPKYSESTVRGNIASTHCFIDIFAPASTRYAGLYGVASP